MLSFHKVQSCIKLQRCVSREADHGRYDASVDYLGHYKRLDSPLPPRISRSDRPLQHCALYCDKVLILCSLFFVPNRLFKCRDTKTKRKPNERKTGRSKTLMQPVDGRAGIVLRMQSPRLDTCLTGSRRSVPDYICSRFHRPATDSASGDLYILHK